MGKNRKNQDIWNIVIIGAGASGMMSAITAAKNTNNKKILLIEQMDKVGKKLLATGNGKCNFTNAYMDSSCFHGDNTWIKQMLSRFGAQDSLSFFHEIGIYPKEKNGYYYPMSEQASSVVFALEQELIRLGICIKYATNVKEIIETTYGFDLKTNQETFYAKKVIIATGLLASPKLGSNGSIFSAIKKLGHHFSPILPALCGFYANGLPFKKISGVRAIGTVEAYVDNQFQVSDTGEIQFTDYGISGIPVFQISHILSKGLYHKKNVTVQIRLLSDFTQEALWNELTFRKNRYLQSLNQTKLVISLLNGLLNQKLADMIFSLCHIPKELPFYALSDKDMKHLCHTIQNLCVTIEKPRDFEFAQVCTGGIPVHEIDTNTLESALIPNLYFAGEILDVDGICGGYNLQWAWTSGYVAGISASKE
ncbi:MAG: NAD(P)/FAD-dependent oxidoreductase [Lachnospiraceae bacterium]|nr:NAD(P)/FAD-dependent oxidoreductase [Lachnospiraceae bacterium]